MPLDKSMSHEDKVKELMKAYKAKGKIGNTTPEDEEDALKIANAIAYSSESLDFNVVTNNGKLDMQEQLNELKKLLEEFPVLEGAKVSQTKYDQESEANKTLEPEDDKSFEEDRLDLEEILTQPTSYKKNYIQRVVKSVNKLIDGTEDVDGLIKTVKCKKKRCK